MHTVVVLAAVCLACVAANPHSVGRFFDDVGAVKQHSFHPPLLADPHESWILSWSFGASTVISDDYVKLTPAVQEGHGYLWNQFPSELQAWRAHFTVRVAQRPHSNLFGGTDTCPFCGVAFWALTEPTRHGETPFFGVPHSFVGVGVIIHQDGEMHLVGKESNTEVSDLSSVALGRCRIKLSTDTVDVLVEFHAGTGVLTLKYQERGASHPIECAHATSGHMPKRYYLGFTAYGKASSPVGYEVLSMMLVPLEGAQEAPVGLKQEAEARQFDHALDQKEQDFWEGRQDADPTKEASPKEEKIPHHGRRDAHNDASPVADHREEGHSTKQRHKDRDDVDRDDGSDSRASRWE